MQQNGMWFVAGVLVLAVPAWAHCGKCGVGEKGASEEGHAGHQHAEVGAPAPDFTLPGADGKEYKLADYKGKVVVLEWTNHTCPFVQRHQGQKKTMQKTLAKFEGKDVVWLAMDSNHFCVEKKDGVLAWSKQNDITYPTLLDPEGKVGHLYGAKTTPHMFVIDAKGVLAYAGAIDDDKYGDKESARNYVEEAVTSLLNGSTVAVARTDSYGCSVKYKQQ